MREQIRAQVAENAIAFDRIAAVAARRAAAGRWDSAAAWARVAGMFAWTNPHDALRDVRLDRALDAIACGALPPAERTPRGRGARRRVLHVLTEGHHVGGGHVPMALRWVGSDRESRHHAAFTRPYPSPKLTATVELQGGDAIVLEQRSLVERARRLRARACEADIVVCHTYPDDPVPAIAFGGGYAGPPVVMVNLADHVFWIGVGNVAMVMNLRDIGAAASVSARGYPDENQLVVPTPLPGVARGLAREEAKRRLGIDPAQTVLVTLARGVKYAPAHWHPGFVDVVAPALRDLPSTTLLAVGADPAEPAWAALRDELPGRVIVPGAQPDPGPYLDAADIYLDSFPFGSVTSMLEAATREVPVLASRAYPGLSKLMSSMGPLDRVVIGAQDTAEYHRQLRRLVADPALRARLGAATGTAVRARHSAGAWEAQLAEVYRLAGEATPVLEREAPEHAHAELFDYGELLLGIEGRAPLLWTILYTRDGFDRADQASALVRTSLVRGLQKLRGTGAAAGAAMGDILIPQGLGA